MAGVDRHLGPLELDEIRVVLGRPAELVPMPGDELDAGIRALYGVGAGTLEGAPADAAPAIAVGDGPAAGEAAVARLVDQLFQEAHRRRATDIHIEPLEDGLRVRYRIDGVLHDALLPEGAARVREAVAARIKVLARLSAAERRVPQDGRLRARLGDDDLDLRVSTLPTPHGESVQVRLLTGGESLDLAALGYEGADLAWLEAFITRPHGVLLLTGPTGSGKTTTLYALLKKLNDPSRKIITIEDPIEYRLRGVTQVQVRPQVGLSFAAGLRSMLRHDPDVMMVGEIRDRETADIAIRVALTGHLVFSTLHTNDAAGAVTRLEDIGVEPYLVSSAVTGVIAQRLVRTLCPACRVETAPAPGLAAEFGLAAGEAAGPVYEGRGCGACAGTGFRGRTAICEVLPVTRDVRDLITSRAPASAIRAAAITAGMRPLRRSGWERVRRGVTSPAEVLRVTVADEA